MKKKSIKGIILMLACVGMMGLFTGCDDDDYKDTLNSGLQKYYSGEKMDKKEYDAVKGYKKWKNKQEKKTYKNWGN